jgi:hypothetical protein
MPKPEQENPEPKDIFEDFDPELFNAPLKPETEKKLEIVRDIVPDIIPDCIVGDVNGVSGLCPYYPKACDKVGTSQCTKKCEHNPDNFITNPKIKEVFDKEPWSNYCFTCGEFVPSRHHENALDPPQLVYSHIVATGYGEYKVKLKRWVMERITGK